MEQVKDKNARGGLVSCGLARGSLASCGLAYDGLPSRDDFHREYGGELTNIDFCTAHPNPHNIKKITRSIAFSRKSAKIFRFKK